MSRFRNVNFDLLPPLDEPIRAKRERRLARMAAPFLLFLATGLDDPAVAQRAPEFPDFPEPVRAMLVFTRFPREDGSFEIEVAIECRFALDDLRLRVQATPDVILAQNLDVQGPRKAGELASWRIRGRFPPAADPPAAVSLMVDYVFPAAAVDRAIREAWPGDVNASARQFLLEELAKRREGHERLIRALELIPRKTEP